MSDKMNSREITITLAGGGIALAMLYYAIGPYGVLSFFTFSLVSKIANTFFFMSIVNVAVKGLDNVNHGETLVLITIGFIFEIIYFLSAHKTMYGFMIETLKSLVVIFVISAIVAYIKKEAEKV